jgi:hypothetical protein
MTVALIDNGSLEAEAHRNLRAVSAALAMRTGWPVAAISWKHSDRIPADALGGDPACTLAPWVRAKYSEGESELLFVPFFISLRGAIASALRADLEKLRLDLGHFEFRFSAGLAGGQGILGQGPGISPLAAIVSDRIRQTLARRSLIRPSVVVVDHGGPSPASAALRDAVAGEIRNELGTVVSSLAAASMESPEGPDFAFNRPLLSELLGAPGYDRGEVVIAPLFLSPGRHAGPAGDLARIARAAALTHPALNCHFTELIGTHPLAAEILAGNLARELTAFSTP